MKYTEECIYCTIITFCLLHKKTGGGEKDQFIFVQWYRLMMADVVRAKLH